jgi:NAD(P)-dependent dehydrogenase (short-subunit alcohol dehydrogenase family)
MDVDSDSSVKTSIANIQKEAGFIEVLINNAGVERSGSVEEIPFDDFRAVMETNYFGPLRCIQAVVPDMRRRMSGCILSVSSVAGRIATSPLAPYTASKFALEALSDALAQEMRCLMSGWLSSSPASSTRVWPEDWRNLRAVLLTLSSGA